MRSFVLRAALLLIGLLLLAGCATDVGGLGDASAKSNNADVPGAERRNPEPSANGGWAW